MNTFANVIDALLDPTIDHKKISIELAKLHPEIFLQIYNNKVASLLAWHREAAHHIRVGQRVDAIKVTRVHTGLGLKEAKDIVDNASHYEGACRLVQPEHQKLADLLQAAL